jgi:hypothetical protein
LRDLPEELIQVQRKEPERLGAQESEKALHNAVKSVDLPSQDL